MNRRKFIETIGKLGVASFILPEVLRASIGPRKKYFLMFHISGGAHPLLGPEFLSKDQLKARELRPISNNDYYHVFNDNDALRFSDNVLVGPALSPLRKHFDNMLIINGVMMKNNSPDHGENRSYMVSGSRRSSAKFGGYYFYDGNESPYIVGSSSGEPQLFPSRSFNLDQNFTSVAMPDIPGLARYLKNPNGSFSPSERKVFQSILVSSNLSDERKKISSFGRVSEKISNALAGFKSNTIKSSLIFLSEGGIDSHENHQFVAIRSAQGLYREISNTIDLMKSIELNNGQSLYDSSIVMITTDFARTSWKEGTDGTSHNPWTNSVMLLGGQLKGRKQIGAGTITPGEFTTDGLSSYHALPYDFSRSSSLNFEEYISWSQSNQRKDSIGLITPEVVFNTVGRLVDPNYESKFMQTAELNEVY